MSINGLQSTCYPYDCSSVRRPADDNLPAVGWDHCPDQAKSGSDGTMVPSYWYELTCRSP